MNKGRTFAIVCATSGLILTGCGLPRQPVATPLPIERLSTEQLIDILRDPNSPEFWSVTSELATRGPAAASAAPVLAQALRYPRRDSYIAGKALVAMGSAAEPAIPYLTEALEDRRSDVRLYAAFILGTIGESSRCAVPELAARLWDSEAWVRSAAAGALEAITGIDLVVETHELKPSHPGSVFADEPEGNITGKARAWWMEQGQHIDWPDKADSCNSGS